jgi:hypothetical protein
LAQSAQSPATALRILSAVEGLCALCAKYFLV